MENKSTQHYVDRLKEISIENKYFKWYLKICSRGKLRGSCRVKVKSIYGYVERHHFLPKSLGGDDNQYNLMFLTAKEHLVAHLLMIKFLQGYPKHQMVYALKRLITDKKHTSRRYEFLKKDFYVAYKIAGAKGRQNRTPPTYTPELRKKLSEAQLKMRRDNPDYHGKEWRLKHQRWMLENNPFRGQKHSSESKAKMSAAIRPTIFCSTCNIDVSHTNFKRFHQHTIFSYTDGKKQYSTLAEMARAHNMSPEAMAYRVKSLHPKMLFFQKL